MLNISRYETAAPFFFPSEPVHDHLANDIRESLKLGGFLNVFARTEFQCELFVHFRGGHAKHDHWNIFPWVSP
jgi:hypothetical protein